MASINITTKIVATTTSSNNYPPLLKQKEVDNRPKPLELPSSIFIRTAFAVNTLPQQLTHSQSTTNH